MWLVESILNKKEIFYGKRDSNQLKKCYIENIVNLYPSNIYSFIRDVTLSRYIKEWRDLEKAVKLTVDIMNRLKNEVGDFFINKDKNLITFKRKSITENELIKLSLANFHKLVKKLIIKGYLVLVNKDIVFAINMKNDSKEKIVDDFIKLSTININEVVNNFE